MTKDQWPLNTPVHDPMNPGPSNLRLLAVLGTGGVVCLGALWLLPGIDPASGLVVALLLVAVASLVVAYRTHRRYVVALGEQQRQLQQASALRLATVEALALAIAARDRSSRSHIRREQENAAALAKAFGLSDAETEGVRTAALLHDIGNLAVPDHILTRPGPLTPEETAKVRVHPQIGAEIISNVPFPYPVASLVLCHHERWDGTGYPAGLKGAEVPLGARIISVVDHFEALTSDRPFHDAVSDDEAVKILWREAGSVLDPVVVARFVELLPTLRLARPGGGDAGAEPAGPGPIPPGEAAGAEPGDGRPSVLDDIALAHQEIYALYDVAQAMGTSLGVADSMTLIATKLRNLVPFSSCALFLHNKADNVARCSFAMGAGASALRQAVVCAGSGLVGDVIARRVCVLNGDPAVDVRSPAGEEELDGLASALVCPLVVGDTTVGALALYHGVPGHFTEDHQRLALRVSGQAAAVIYNAVIFEQTQEASVTDQLTGLPNTRFLFLHLNRELSRAGRLGSSVALLIVDLDNLKGINDSLGHHTGDRALREVASVLRRAIRPYDAVVRYGGDEFIVLLSDCGAEAAEAKRDELQQAVDALSFVVRGTQRVRLAVSAGVAVFPQDGESYDALLATADSRMYRDKTRRRERNRDLSTAGPSGGGLAEVELQRAAAGVL